MAYVTKIQLQNYLQRELKENEEAFLHILAPAIKSWIDKKLSSTFDKVEPSTRRYDGGTAEIDIDPCINITEVTNLYFYSDTGYTYTNELEYVLWPPDRAVKTSIRHRWGYLFPKGTSNMRVTATFSEYDNGVPQDIITAACRIASQIIASAKNPQNLFSESLEGHSITYLSRSGINDIAMNDPIVKSIMDMRSDRWVG